MNRRRPFWGLTFLSLFFFATAFLFVPRLGIEADEAMIANGIYDHGAPLYSWKFGAAEVPVMLISYLGALKTWLYNPYFAIWPPSAVSLRLPSVLAGVATLWLFFSLLDRLAGRTAAWIGTVLLATDSIFLLIESTDFGFVALQFVLKLAAILLLLRFHREGHLLALAGGFFCFGLALWDKAVFIWVLAGLAVATLVVAPRVVWRYLTLRNVAVAVASMTVGALPLVIYNVARPLETLRGNAKVAAELLVIKERILLHTIDGSALLGFVTSVGPQSSVLPRRNLIIPTIAIAVFLTLTLWWRKVGVQALFGLVACAVTWLLMAFTAGAGGAVQHTILLWPFHLLIIAVALAQLPQRWAGVLTMVLCLSNLAMTYRYYSDLIHNGPAIRWSDAMNPLEQHLSSSEAQSIYVADWGIIETLSLLSQGRLPVYSADVRDTAMLDRIIASQGEIFVSHTPDFTFDSGIRARLEDRARNTGFEEQRMGTIADSHARPTFEIFRFRSNSERK